MFQLRKTLEKPQFKINNVIKLLTLADVFVWGPYMIIMGFAGIYLSDKFGEPAIEYVGTGLAIYYLTRGILQLPIGMLTDKIKRDRDELLFLIIGCVLIGAPFLYYPFISHPDTYYFLQFVFGLGTAMNITNWRKLFAQNLDANHEGLEYGFYEIVMSLATAAFTSLGGMVASLSDFYFDAVMVGSGAFMISSSIWVSLVFLAQNRKSAKK
jgi:MFS family permease